MTISIHSVIKSPTTSPRCGSSGMTLVEVMVAMLVLVFSALSLVKLIYYLNVTADDNITQNTALVMAQDYLEQLCAKSYQSLQIIADDTQGKNAPISLTDHSGNSTSNGGVNLYNGKAYIENLNLDQDTAGNGTFPMTFQFKPVLNDLSSVGNASGVEIIIYFTATYNLGNPRTFQGSVRTVHANIQH